MKSHTELTTGQKAMIIAIMLLSTVLNSLKVAVLIAENGFNQPEEQGKFILQIVVVPLTLSVIAGYFRGWISFKVLGILCSEITCSVFLIIGNFMEPHLNQLYQMGCLYLTFFFQAQLFENATLKFICHTKPLVGVFFYGIVSGTLYVKERDEFLCCLCILSFGISGVLAFTSVEENKRKLYQALKETKLQLASVISAVPVGIIVIGQSGEVVLSNATCLTKLGISDAGQILSSLKGLKYIKDSNKYSGSNNFIDDLMNYIDSDSTEQARFGATFNHNASLSWIGQKTVWHSSPAVVVVIKDVTDILQLERSQAESRFKNVLLRSVSHELKTPTNGILHSVQAVTSQNCTPPWIKDKLAVAEVSCKHLLNLISDLLDFSQLIAEKFRLNKSFFNVRNVLGDCVELMQLLAKKKKIALELIVDPLVPETAFSDLNRMSQVLLNLLSNAIKFTHTRGWVKVMAVLTDDFMLEISVSDSGIGISPENKFRLFQAFSCLEEANLLCSQSTGLGLHISNMLAKQLGKKSIKVESVVDQGSCFSFIVDFHQSPRTCKLDFSQTNYWCDDISVVQKVPSFKRKPKKLPPVLIVDDSPFNRTVLSDILNSIHIESAEANTGKEALDYVVRRALESNPVKVVIMDYEMPEMNGPTACRAIMSELSQYGIKLPYVIAHTAYSSEDDIQLCLDSGMVEYLPKPSSQDTISKMVYKYLNYYSNS
mmetsp:Transcript_31295/g.54349  ORF Transcript_31295/g.54349 Transcript_31295/m.54349 type:complete len:712 (+) Transcript_31295:71-2206(+)